MNGRLLNILLLVLLGRAIPACGQPAGTETGKLQDPACKEISGLAASALHPGVLYLHNDSGDISRFFAISKEGKLLGTYAFKGDPYYPNGVKDCEDIATGPGPDPRKKYIYLGDIGDNLKIRYYLNVYRFEEPAVLGNSNIARQAVHLKYPDGPKDAETLMADPLSGSLYLVSKRDDTVSIYSTPLLFNDGDTVALAKKGTLFLKGKRPGKWVVSGDISPDGSQVLIKTLENVYYWKRGAGETLEQALQRAPIELPYRQEPQGESIGFTADGKGYYTISEGQGAGIYYYPLPK